MNGDMRSSEQAGCHMRRRCSPICPVGAAHCPRAWWWRRLTMKLNTRVAIAGASPFERLPILEIDHQGAVSSHRQFHSAQRLRSVRPENRAFPGLRRLGSGGQRSLSNHCQKRDSSRMSAGSVTSLLPCSAGLSTTRPPRSPVSLSSRLARSVVNHSGCTT